MLRCTSSVVIPAYAKVRLIPQDSRALPAAFLRSRPIFMAFKTFYEVIIFGGYIFLKYSEKSVFMIKITFEKERGSLYASSRIG
jgi:hypothetical protein